MIDNDDTLDNLNELTKFIMAQNPMNVGIIDKLISIIDNVVDINTDLSNILYIDNISDIDKYDKILSTLRSAAVTVIKKYGIIVDADLINDIPIIWYYNILYTLNQFNNLNSVEYLLINDYMSDIEELHDDNSIIDLTYKIFNIVNTNISYEMFIEYIDKVYINFIDIFKKHVLTVLKNMDDGITNNDVEISDDVITLVNLFMSIEYDNIPDIISDIINDNTILDVLIINSDNKYLNSVLNKIRVKPDYVIIMDYYIIKLLDGKDVNDITDDLNNILMDEYQHLLNPILKLFKDKNIPNTINNIHNKYLEENS